jgi:hypothetical protein
MLSLVVRENERLMWRRVTGLVTPQVRHVNHAT